MARPNSSVYGAYVARQPILGATGHVFGYELLYRAAPDALACDERPELAAARVLNDSVLTLGLEALTGGRRAFMNLTREMLLGEFATLLQADAVVIEVLEDVVVDAPVLAACRRLRDLGYAIALDDFRPDGATAALLPYARFAKVDVLATSEAERRTIERTLPPHVHLIAEKVETAEVFEQAVAAGYRLFQGYHFCRPRTFAGGALTARQLAVTRLLAVLHRPDASVIQVEHEVKHDPALVYRVLRCVNSAAFSLSREVRSIRQALVLLGLDQVRKWASVWALAGLNGGTSELVTVSLLRARCCELVAQDAVGGDASSEYFLLGLCSLLDVILEHPMDEAIRELPLSHAVRGALLGERNPARAVLDAVTAYERGHWDEAMAASRQLALRASCLPDAYTDALQWSRHLSPAAA